MRRFRFAAVTGALALATAHAGAASGSQRFFLTPGPNGSSCELDVGMPGLPTSAWCVVEPPRVPLAKTIGVSLSPSGRVKICNGARCAGNPPERTKTLRYGQSISLGPFRCTSLKRGVRCVVVKLGRGFVLGAAGVKRV